MKQFIYTMEMNDWLKANVKDLTGELKSSGEIDKEDLLRRFHSTFPATIEKVTLQMITPKVWRLTHQRYKYQPKTNKKNYSKKELDFLKSMSTDKKLSIKKIAKLYKKTFGVKRSKVGLAIKIRRLKRANKFINNLPVMIRDKVNQEIDILLLNAHNSIDALNGYVIGLHKQLDKYKKLETLIRTIKE